MEAVMAAITALVRESSQAAFPIVGDAAEARYLIERLEQQGWTVAAAAAPAPALDVERLLRACSLVGLELLPMQARAIARQYARLAAQPKEGERS
jgi:hypothetical protein